MRRPPSNPLYRRLQPLKCAFLNARCDLSAHTRIHHALVDDNRASSLSDTLNNGLTVPGINCAEIDELDRDAKIAFCGGEGGGSCVERVGVGRRSAVGCR